MYAKQSNWPLCTTYLGYCLGNCGLLALELAQKG